ncbi:hypothetical protein FVER53590_28314 [Fusarium verticillioides]|nr:hypothetical protein FVER53590_28314 [Fusarium verticillioides]
MLYVCSGPVVLPRQTPTNRLDFRGRTTHHSLIIYIPPSPAIFVSLLYKPYNTLSGRFKLELRNSKRTINLSRTGGNNIRLFNHDTTT